MRGTVKTASWSVNSRSDQKFDPPGGLRRTPGREHRTTDSRTLARLHPRAAAWRLRRQPPADDDGRRDRRIRDGLNHASGQPAYLRLPSGPLFLYRHDSRDGSRVGEARKVTVVKQAPAAAPEVRTTVVPPAPASAPAPASVPELTSMPAPELTPTAEPAGRGPRARLTPASHTASRLACVELFGRLGHEHRATSTQRACRSNGGRTGSAAGVQRRGDASRARGALRGLNHVGVLVYPSQVSRLAQRLREAREAANFSVDTMAKLVGLDPEEVRLLESGTKIPPTAVVRRYATMFGTRVRRFLEHGAAQSPATLLFRSAAEHGTDLSEELRTFDLRILGDFLACVADVHELEVGLGLPAPTTVDIGTPDRTAPAWAQGRECARIVREQLALGTEPIPSMVALLDETLHWSTFFVTPDDLCTAIQGASTNVPRPAILVNLVGGREAWWRTRVSLAHEMCHVVLDARGQVQPYLFSPEGELEIRNRWMLVDHFRSVEQRANSFAVHFLVPSGGLRRLIGRASAETEGAINDVCRNFGVGRTVAIHRLGHEYKLDKATEDRMLARHGTVAHAPEHPDAAIVPGLRTGRLRRLVINALAAGHIDGIEARSILDVRMTEPIEGAEQLSPPSFSPRTSRVRARKHMSGRSLGGPVCPVPSPRPSTDGMSCSNAVAAKSLAARSSACPQNLNLWLPRERAWRATTSFRRGRITACLRVW